MAHHQQLCVTVLHGLSIKLQRAFVEPSRSGFFVVMKGKPNVFEFADLRVVTAPP